MNIQNLFQAMTSDRSTLNWNQRVFEEENILNPNGSRPSHVRQIPSRAETPSSQFDGEVLQSSVSFSSLDRHPVQHPPGNENGSSDFQESPERSFFPELSPEINQDDSVINAPFHSGAVSMQNGEGSVSQAALHNGHREIYSNSERHRANAQPRVRMMQSSQYPTQEGLEQSYFEQHPSAFGHPNYVSLRHSIPSQMRPSQAVPIQPYSSASYFNFRYYPPRLPYQHCHLETGYKSSPQDIGLQESLIGISCPTPVRPKKTEYAHQVSADFNQSDDIAGSEYNEDSIPSGVSFHTMNPSFEEQRSEGKKTPTHYHNQGSRDYRPGTTASTQPCHNAVATQPPASTRPYQLEHVKVFITYATEHENVNHTRTVVQISQTLLQNSINVAVDVLEEKMRAISSSEWLDNNIRNSTFVLICISPSYRKVVEGQSTLTSSPYQEKEKAINTQYIYRRIQTEYIRNGSKNFRFIPVLVSGANMEHVPDWLCDTRVFEWPSDYEDIIFRLFKKERFIKPKPGPPPKHTIERYSTSSHRKSSRDSDRSSRGNTEPKKVD